jgi:hypothetical protein
MVNYILFKNLPLANSLFLVLTIPTVFITKYPPMKRKTCFEDVSVA